MSAHEVYVVEHGARAGTVYGSCGCGWSGPPRRSYERAESDAAAHADETAALSPSPGPAEVARVLAAEYEIEAKEEHLAALSRMVEAHGEVGARRMLSSIHGEPGTDSFPRRAVYGNRLRSHPIDRS